MTHRSSCLASSGFRYYSWSCTPWHSNVQKISGSAFCVAWHEQAGGYLGKKHVCLAKDRRFTGMSQLHCSMDTFQIDASNGFMSTLLDHCPFPKENHICSQLLTATLVGLKPSQWLMLLPLHVHSLCCHSISHGLGFQKMSPLTEGHSLPLLCGLP